MRACVVAFLLLAVAAPSCAADEALDVVGWYRLAVALAAERNLDWTCVAVRVRADGPAELSVTARARLAAFAPLLACGTGSARLERVGEERLLRRMLVGVRLGGRAPTAAPTLSEALQALAPPPRPAGPALRRLVLEPPMVAGATRRTTASLELDAAEPREFEAATVLLQALGSRLLSLSVVRSPGRALLHAQASLDLGACLPAARLPVALDALRKALPGSELVAAAPSGGRSWVAVRGAPPGGLVGAALGGLLVVPGLRSFRGLGATGPAGEVSGELEFELPE